MNVTRMPWGPDQVDSLNAYQAEAPMHPFTCINRGDDGHDDGHPFEGLLLATPSGWVCPDCDYRQDWAHAFMADWSWRAPTPDMTAQIFGIPKRWRLMTDDEKQALHEQGQADDENHDVSSCVCCCIDCEIMSTTWKGH